MFPDSGPKSEQSEKKESGKPASADVCEMSDGGTGIQAFIMIGKVNAPRVQSLWAILRGCWGDQFRGIAVFQVP